jgi:cytoskeletal protein CcmA (bactofilin family)
MWKKSDETPDKPKFADNTSTPLQTPKAAERSVMGSTLTFKGEIFGEENLVIQSEVEGLVDLRDNSVTIGKNGRLKADLYGKNVTIEGKIVGNIVGFDSVRITQTGSVKGNVTSPRVTLEDGARFKGSIDMDMPKNKAAEVKPVLNTPTKTTTAAESSSDIVKPKTI